MKRIYFDNAATTPLRQEVVEAMLPCYTELYGNPSSSHREGQAARNALEKARMQVAAAIGAKAGEIYFTSGGSESDNWAIRCGCKSNIAKGKHIITSGAEHHAVLHTCQALEKEGYSVTYLPVDAQAMVAPQAVQQALREDTVLVTVMAANNEVGTLQPIREIAAMARRAGALMHTDAVQALGAIPIDMEAWGVDLLSLSAHKCYGPKGAGALYIRKGTHLHSLLYGGAQERGLRAGTENLAGAVGMGTAVRLMVEERSTWAPRVTALRDRLIRGIQEAIPDARFHGHPTQRLAGHVNVSFPGVKGEALLMRLDMEGVAASGGSACTSGSPSPSHVLLSMGLSQEEARGSVRFSLGKNNTLEEVEAVLSLLPGLVRALQG